MTQTLSTIGCQQVLLHPDPELRAVLDYLCGQANKVFNCAVYYARQVWFKERRIVGQGEICRQMKHNIHFRAMYASSAQQICNGVVESLRSFRRLWDLFWAGRLDNRPSPPKYRKAGLFTVSYPRKWLKVTEQGIRVPLGKQVKAWFGLDCFYLPIPTNLDWAKVREIRILPRNGCFYVEFVHRMETPHPELDPSQALGIDHGVTNWLTCIDTLGHSFIVDGRHLKSLNQGYNRRVAMLKTGQPQGFWSKQLGSLTEKRNRQMRDAINKAARLVVNHCLNHGIGTVVFGWNPGQKQKADMGTKGNQNFVQIPTARLKTRIQQLCQQYGIQFVETEEAYSSQASFLDGDCLPQYGEKPDGWVASGKRIKRGLYRTAAGYLVNADCNGAANILRKVARRLGLTLDRLGRGALTTPLRVRLWAT